MILLGFPEYEPHVLLFPFIRLPMSSSFLISIVIVVAEELFSPRTRIPDSFVLSHFTKSSIVLFNSLIK